MGSVMTVAFELDGQPFVALNGGPISGFTGAVSFAVNESRRVKAALLGVQRIDIDALTRAHAG